MNLNGRWQDSYLPFVIGKLDKINYKKWIGLDRRMRKEYDVVVLMDENNTEISKIVTLTLSNFAKNIRKRHIIDPKKISFSKWMNCYLRKKECADYVIVMCGEYMISINTLERLVNDLEINNKAGAVGPISNGFGNLQSYQCNTFEKMLEDSVDNHNRKCMQTLSLYPDIVALKRSVAQKVTWDEELKSLHAIILDAGFQMILQGYELLVDKNSLCFQYVQKEEMPFYEVNEKGLKEVRQKWNIKYFSNFPKQPLMDLMNKGEEKSIEILDVGCSCGANLIGVKNKYPNAVLCGVEMEKGAARIASSFADVRTGMIEEEKEYFGKNRFDYIMFADVLEHLHDPEQILLDCRDMLKEDGGIIACIPNLMHISVMKEILKGKFPYLKDGGLLDVDHVHFFTYYEMLEMFQKVGYEIESCISVKEELSEEDKILIRKLCEIGENTSEMMYETFQYVIRAGKRELGE